MAAKEIATETVIVGASAAGLATAACLKPRGTDHILLERSEAVGAAWRGHYERLHLHTNKGASGLPYLGFPKGTPRYPSRDQVIAYLERYASELGLAPRFGQTVTAIRRYDRGWITEVGAERYVSRNVVIATGFTRVPWLPDWPGRAEYRGQLLHSSAYRSGASFRDRRVLVVGFGNSAGEIAIDLHEQGAHPTLAVRGAVNVISREIFGIPILLIGALLSLLPPRLADLLSAPLLRLVVGDIKRLGLRKLPYGPMQQIRRDHHVPLIDIGTMAQIRAGHIAVRGGVERLTTHGVRFANGAEEPFDAVVMATGYRANVSEFLRDAEGLCDRAGSPLISGKEAAPGLYFCGFHVSPIGMLRQIGKEARQIAQSIHRASHR